MVTSVYFNSRPSARGDCFFRTGKNRHEFQFTPLREGRQRFQAPPLFGKHFNSRPSARGDASLQHWREKFCKFQFTPLREGRRCMACVGAIGISFQFTPLREGRPLRMGRENEKDKISIHAPPRGATFGNIRVFVEEGDFNSRPSARGDMSLIIRSRITEIFQFTPLREGRHHSPLNLLI